MSKTKFKSKSEKLKYGTREAKKKKLRDLKDRESMRDFLVKGK